jgi:transcriptional regulator with XRE-family HTH domain
LIYYLCVLVLYQKKKKMLLTISKRIKEIRTDKLKVSQFEFSEQVGMTQANLFMLENGKIYPSCFLLFKLHQLYKINLNWLLTGEGTREMPLLLAAPNIKTTDNEVVI